MPPVIKDEFEFPDEKEAKEVQAAEKEENFEIEIEDDTPPEDRNRRPSKEPVDDPTEEELSSYDEKVQQRIKKFTRGYHDERRAKEEALREREAVENYAKQLIEENKRLQQQVALGSQAYVEQSKTSAQANFESAKKKHKEAYESGDPDLIAEANAEIARATLNLDKAENMRPLQVEEKDVKPTINNPLSNPKPTISSRDQEWMDENEWFGKDPEMTATALGLHQRLTQEKGQRFIGTREYYKVVDATMRKRFPEYFGSEQQEDPVEEDEPPRRATKPAVVVAPATRSTPPNRVKLKASEAAIARRLGVPLKQYAEQVAILKRGA